MQTLAPQSSLCEMIIYGLRGNDQELLVQAPWFIIWLWTTTGGAALYALTVGLVTAVSGKGLLSANRNGGYTHVQGDGTNGDHRDGAAIFSLIGRCCGCSAEKGNDADNAEKRVRALPSSNPASPVIKGIVASFNAWLFADSKVLWAVLVSKIFDNGIQPICYAKSPLLYRIRNHAQHPSRYFNVKCTSVHS